MSYSGLTTNRVKVSYFSEEKGLWNTNGDHLGFILLVKNGRMFDLLCNRNIDDLSFKKRAFNDHAYYLYHSKDIAREGQRGYGAYMYGFPGKN